MNAAEQREFELLELIESGETGQLATAEMIRRVVTRTLGPRTLNGIYLSDIPDTLEGEEFLADSQGLDLARAGALIREKFNLNLPARAKAAYALAYALIEQSDWHARDAWPTEDAWPSAATGSPCPGYHQPAATFSLRNWLRIIRQHNH